MGSGASKKRMPVEHVKTVYLCVNGEIVPVSELEGCCCCCWCDAVWCVVQSAVEAVARANRCHLPSCTVKTDSRDISLSAMHTRMCSAACSVKRV